jgi:Calx-beta domain-containing protein/beta-propeller uncharacterized protein DUF5122
MGTSRALLLLSLSAFIVLVVPSVGEAQWVTDGRALCTANGNQVGPAIISDGAGGAIVTWQDIRNGNPDIYAQRVLASGAVDPAWPVDGRALCTAAEQQGPPIIVSDGSGGAIVAWQDLRNGMGNYDVYAQRVLASGAVDPAWPVDGRALCTAANHQTGLAIISDGAGGAIVTWEDSRSGTSDIYAQHVLSTGAVDPAWPLDGRALCTADNQQTGQIITADGTGGAIIAWNDFRSGTRWDIYAQHVLSSGAVDPAWPFDGRALCPDANPNGSTIGIASDGAGGEIVVWTDTRDDAGDIYAQYVDSAGGVGGSLDGYTVCAAFAGQYDPKIVADGVGGTIVTWRDLRNLNNFDIYALRLGGGGAWPVNGLLVCGALSDQVPSAIVSDGAGGAIITWADARNGTDGDIYAQHVLSTGVVDGVWPADGGALCTAAGSQNSPAIVGIGAGRAIVAWGDNRTGTSYDIYANRFSPPPVSIGDVTLSEGNSGTSNAVFTVRIPTESLQPVTVQYQTHDGSATVADNDYVGASGVATIPAHDTVGTVSIAINGDGTHESDETFTVTISNPNNAVIEDGVGQGTIVNDDPVPAVSIGDLVVNEGNSGTRNAVFTVSLSNPTSDDVTVDFHTEDGTATLANHDYVYNYGDVTISGEATTTTITVLVNGDLTLEADETFNVVLTTPQNATIADGTGQCTITSIPAILEDLYVTNGPVEAAAVSGNTLYIGGSFTQVGPATGSAVPIDASSGAAAAGFPKVVGTVQAIVSDGTGGWYLGGTFSSVGGQVRTNLAHIEANLAVSPWAPSANNTVNAIAVSGGTVYVGGTFTSVGGQPRNFVAALSPTTGLATTWNPSANGNVTVLAANGATVYAAGTFSAIGGTTRVSAAAIDATTGLATSWNPGPNNFVRTLIISGSTVYAGGDFTSIGGQVRNYIAALDATSGLATAWNPNANSTVYAMALSGTTLYEGGAFTTVGGQPRNYIAALSATTGLATVWNPNSIAPVTALAVGGGTIYAGGLFRAIGGQSIGGQSRDFLAAVDGTTGLATAWNPSPNYPVSTLAVNGTTVYAGGISNFNSLGGQARSSLAALDLATGLPTSWNPGVSGEVRSLLVVGPLVYVGGSFEGIGGGTRHSVAAVDGVTGITTSWDPNVSNSFGSTYVSALAVSGSTVYLGGTFTGVGSATRHNIAAVDAATGLATSWNPNADGWVRAIVASGANLYLGGSFSTVGGQARGKIAAVELTTGLPTDWSPDASGGPADVTCLASSAGGLYAGGKFTSIGGQVRNGIAELDLSTGLATAWNPAASFAQVFGLAASGNTVYVGGIFNAIGGQTRNNFAALDATSGLALGLDPSPNGTVECIVATDGILAFGGGFSGAGVLPQSNLVGIGVVEEVPTLSINDVAVAEGDAGSTIANLTLGLSGMTGFPVTVHYQTQDGSATLANADYVAASGTATIDPKTLSVTLPIQVNGDTKHEADETLTVTISSPVNAQIGRATGQVTILNDDGTPSLSINDVTIAEGDTGSVSAVFTVKLSHPTDQPVRVLFHTQNGSATVANNDYVAVSDTVIVPVKSDSATISVSVIGDLTNELNETFAVVLSDPVNAMIADSSGIGTILNDDPDATPPAIPTPFTGVFSGGPVQLHWGANTEPDFASYHLYRDTTADFVPGPGNLVVSKPDTGYVDAGSTWSYYKLSALDMWGNQSGFALLVPSGQASGATPAGGNVPVSLANVHLTFGNVTGSGVTSLTTSTGGQPPPNGLKVAPGSPKLYYELTTTASFTGPVTVCVTYDPAYVSGQESNLKLMHYDTAAVPPGWVEVTTSVDVGANVICGTVTHFSEFALMESDGTVDVREEIPSTVQLYPCAPNPVLSTALIRFDLPVAAPVRLGLFDLQGRLVRDLERQANKGPGRYVLPWDGRGDDGRRLKAGIYFLRFEAGGFSQVRRVALIN